MLLLTFGIAAQAQSKKQSQSVEQIAKQKADSIVKGVEQQMYNMSFEEFEKLANSSPYRGQFTRAELKRDYNKLHKNDGRAVKIYPEDYEKNKDKKAIEAMGNAQTYDEFRRYAKIVSPDLSEKELLYLWEAQKKKNKSKKTKKKREELNKTSANQNHTIGSDDDLGLTDLFRDDSDDSQSRKANKGASEEIDLNELDLGSIMDAMESDEAAELGKKMDEMEQRFDDGDAERKIAEMEDRMPTDRVDFMEKSELTHRQTVTLDAALTANDDPNVSLSERKQKLREYGYSFGADERTAHMLAEMYVNRDPKKGVKGQYDNKRKKDYEKHLKDYEHGKMKLDEDEIELVLEGQLRDDYGIEVPGGMSQRELREFTHEFLRETEKQRGWDDDTWDNCLEKVAKRHGFERKYG